MNTHILPSQAPPGCYIPPPAPIAVPSFLSIDPPFNADPQSQQIHPTDLSCPFFQTMTAIRPPAPRNQALAIRPPGQALMPSDPVAIMCSNSPIPEVSGYCFFNRKAKDNTTGKYLLYVLENKKIDLEKEPPLQTITKEARFATQGVVKINNIPFAVNYQEIAQFINRFAPTPMIKKNHDGYPIHIIMEKPTGKTMDCFVEFPSIEAAWDCVKRFEYQQIGRLTKLGTRNVTLDMSSQAELMEAIFPRARLVHFDRFNGEPSVLAQGKDQNWSEGFRGFFTLEEVYGIIKFAEYPGRSPFVLKCHQRVYESMISTLYKFPWASTGTYTVAARNALFEAAYKQLTVLSPKVGCSLIPSPANQMVSYKNSLHHNQPDLHLDNREVGLSQTLLFDLLFAAVNVPAFSYLQKQAICQAVGSYGRGIEIGHFADHWPFQTLGPAKGESNHAIKFWLELFDTGYDLIVQEGAKTTFEKYITFTRNKVGFPIGEWTKDGTELPFELATRLEHAVMMIYVERGRAQWCFERSIHIEPWETITLNEFMRDVIAENNIHEYLDDDEDSVSPRTSVAFSLEGIDPLKLITARLAKADSNSTSVIDPLQRNSSLNPATATEFIPVSLRNASGTSSDNTSYVHGSASMITTPTKPKAMRPKSDLTAINTSGIQQSFTNPWATSPTALARAVNTPSDKSNAGVPLNLSLDLDATRPNITTVGEQMRTLSLGTTTSRASASVALQSPATGAPSIAASTPTLTTSPTNYNYDDERRYSGASVSSTLLRGSYVENHASHKPRTGLINIGPSTSTAITAPTLTSSILPTNPFGPIGSRLPPSGPRNSMYHPVNPIIEPEKGRAYSVPVVARLLPDTVRTSVPRVDVGVDVGIAGRQRGGPGGRLSSAELWAGLGKKFLENLN